jgi:hypothetical protein
MSARGAKVLINLSPHISLRGELPLWPPSPLQKTQKGRRRGGRHRVEGGKERERKESAVSTSNAGALIFSW